MSGDGRRTSRVVGFLASFAMHMAALWLAGPVLQGSPPGARNDVLISSAARPRTLPSPDQAVIDSTVQHVRSRPSPASVSVAGREGDGVRVPREARRAPASDASGPTPRRGDHDAGAG